MGMTRQMSLHLSRTNVWSLQWTPSWHCICQWHISYKLFVCFFSDIVGCIPDINDHNNQTFIHSSIYYHQNEIINVISAGLWWSIMTNNKKGRVSLDKLSGVILSVAGSISAVLNIWHSHCLHVMSYPCHIMNKIGPFSPITSTLNKHYHDLWEKWTFFLHT